MSDKAGIVCDLDAIGKDQRDGHLGALERLFGMVEEQRVLDNGVALRLPNDIETVMFVAQTLATERLCCSFFRFKLILEPESGPLWVEITGPEGVNAFIRDQMMSIRAVT